MLLQISSIRFGSLQTFFSIVELRNVRMNFSIDVELENKWSLRLSATENLVPCGNSIVRIKTSLLPKRDMSLFHALISFGHFCNKRWGLQYSVTSQITWVLNKLFSPHICLYEQNRYVWKYSNSTTDNVCVFWSPMKMISPQKRESGWLHLFV